MKMILLFISVAGSHAFAGSFISESSFDKIRDGVSYSIYSHKDKCETKEKELCFDVSGKDPAIYVVRYEGVPLLSKKVLKIHEEFRQSVQEKKLGEYESEVKAIERREFLRSLKGPNDIENIKRVLYDVIQECAY